MTQTIFCRNCGAPLQPDARFCDKCGQTVGAGAYPPPRPQAPVYSQPQRSFPWWAVILGGACLCVLCLTVVGVGGYAYFQDLIPGLSAVPEPVIPQAPTFPENPPTPTLVVPPPILEPTEPDSTESGPMLTGNQQSDSYYLFDDFSSEALKWPVYDDGKTIMNYENGTYSIQIAEPEYIDWAYFPVDFTPYEIWFDVQGTSGQQDGTFGVFCQYQDADNYYYAELDLETNSYILAQFYNGDDIPLTKQNTVGQFWYETSALNSPPTSINRIGVSCYLDSITLFINDQWVDEVNVQHPFDQPGEAAFFVYTFNFADADGYKIFFDNVEVYQPVQ